MTTTHQYAFAALVAGLLLFIACEAREIHRHLFEIELQLIRSERK